MFHFSVRIYTRHFHPTICFVCGKKAAQCSLKSCGGCKLLVYCSVSHQKLHWPQHKNFCLAARTIALKINCSYLFEDGFKSKQPLWSKYLVTILMSLMKELKRPLSVVEKQIILVPNCCIVCKRYETSMLTCTKCSYVWYCCIEHKALDADAHGKLCEDFSNVLELEIDGVHSGSDNLIEGYIVTDFNKFPDSLECFMNDSVQLEVYSNNLGKKLSKINLSDNFSYQMTTIYALKQCEILCQNSSRHSRNLVIHVVGAQEMEASNINLWKCLDVIQNNFNNILIVLVGPELNLCLSDFELESTGRLKFKTSKQFYHKFYREENFEPPDLIIAFNCGFHEWADGPPKHNTWRKSIKYFCKHPNTVIVFTSYTKSEAVEDLDYFIKNCACEQLEIVRKHELNPFRSLKPNYNWELSEDTFFYYNNFITILRTESV